MPLMRAILCNSLELFGIVLYFPKKEFFLWSETMNESINQSMHCLKAEVDKNEPCKAVRTARPIDDHPKAVSILEEVVRVSPCGAAYNCGIVENRNKNGRRVLLLQSFL